MMLRSGGAGQLSAANDDAVSMLSFFHRSANRKYGRIEVSSVVVCWVLVFFLTVNRVRESIYK